MAAIEGPEGLQLTEAGMVFMRMFGVTQSWRLPNIMLYGHQPFARSDRWVLGDADVPKSVQPPSSDGSGAAALTEFYFHDPLVPRFFPQPKWQSFRSLAQEELEYLLRRNILISESRDFAQYLRLAQPWRRWVKELADSHGVIATKTSILHRLSNILPDPCMFQLQQELAANIRELLQEVVVPTFRAKPSIGKLKGRQIYRLAFFSLLCGLPLHTCDLPSWHDASDELFDTTVQLALRGFLHSHPSIPASGSGPIPWALNQSDFDNMSPTATKMNAKIYVILIFLIAAWIPHAQSSSTDEMKDAMTHISDGLSVLWNEQNSLQAITAVALGSAVFTPFETSRILQTVPFEVAATIATMVASQGTPPAIQQAVDLLQHIFLSQASLPRRMKSESDMKDSASRLEIPYFAAEVIKHFLADGRHGQAVAIGETYLPPKQTRTRFWQNVLVWHSVGIAYLTLALADAYMAQGEYAAANQILILGLHVYPLASYLKVALSLRINLTRRRLRLLEPRDIGTHSALHVALSSMTDLDLPTKEAILEEVIATASFLKRSGLSSMLRYSSLFTFAYSQFSLDRNFAADWRLKSLQALEFHPQVFREPSFEPLDMPLIPRLLQARRSGLREDTLMAEFCDFLDGCLTYGIEYGTRSTALQGQFIPDSLLKAFYENLEEVETLLAEVNETNLKSSSNTILAKILSKTCYKVFSILFLLGCGDLIKHFTANNDIHDSKLPFRNRPKHFPDVGNLWEAFEEIQWAFCVGCLWETGPDRTIKPDMKQILPIAQREYVSEGGCATVDQVRFHRGYEPSLWNSSDTSHISPTGRTYALKSFNTKSAKHYYETEMRAFRYLQGLNLRPSGLIEFYGGIECSLECSILLEYADMGDLNQYWRRIPPPTTTKDILHFWTAMFRLVQALTFFHTLPKVSETERLFGWHQDIKPSNVLVVSGSSNDPYEVKVKLADFGLSHFKKDIAGPEEILDWGKYGNTSYGAPECAPSLTSVSIPASSRTVVSQAVDIWSLGCIYSEAVTWTILGYPGLKSYRRARYDESVRNVAIKESALNPSVCFHDGKLRLKCIRDTHQTIRERCSSLSNDASGLNLIAAVVDSVDQMLEASPNRRPTSEELWATLQTSFSLPEDNGKSKETANNNENTSREMRMIWRQQTEHEDKLAIEAFNDVKSHLERNEVAMAKAKHELYLSIIPSYRMKMSVLMQWLEMRCGGQSFELTPRRGDYHILAPFHISVSEVEHLKTDD